MTKSCYVIAYPPVGCKSARPGQPSGAALLAAAKAPAVAVAPGGLADVGEDAPDLRMVGAAAAVEMHAAMAADEQRGVKMAFEHADAMGDGGRSDAELFGGTGKALVPGGCFEEGQAVEWRERFHGLGGVGAHGVA